MIPKIEPFDFACRCSVEERERSDTVLAWAIEYLAASFSSLLTAAVVKLHIDYRAQIDGIWFDQWAAVNTTCLYEKDDAASFSTVIQCDRVEDGLAFTIKAYYDQFGDVRPELV